MFGVLDLTTVAIIQDKLNRLSKCPEYLDFLLCGFTRSPLLLEIVGPNYIKEARQFIVDNKIRVLPYYNVDMQSLPTISVIASGQEEMKFIGDEGWTRSVGRTPPATIAQWDAERYDKNVMHVSSAYDLQDKVWPGLFVTGYDTETKTEFKSQIEAVLDNGSALCLAADIPPSVSLKGWKAVTGGSDKIQHMNSSADEVSIAIQLTTNGDPSVHRLLAVVLRYILKSSRLTFDRHGLHEARVGYQPMVIEDQTELIFQSVFHVDGKFVDHWVASESLGIDPATNIMVGITTTRNAEPEEDVKLE